jgi:hypothetical protein
MVTATFPDMRATKVNEVILISHSNLLYWWPAFVVGYLMALATYFQGNVVTTNGGNISYIHTSNNPGLLFIAILIGLIVFSNAKLRGIYSVVALITFGFFAVLFAWLGWWDEILSLIPQLSAKANIGFYLVFSTALLIVWSLGVFVFDRISYWRVRPGQFAQISHVGGGAQNFDTQGMRFERREQDYFRHIVLGLGSGDLVFYGKDLQSGSITIPNVSFVDKKAIDIERLIAIKPDV